MTVASQPTPRAQRSGGTSRSIHSGLEILRSGRQFGRGRQLAMTVAAVVVMYAAGFYFWPDSVMVHPTVFIAVDEVVGIVAGSLAMVGLLPKCPSFEIAVPTRARRWGVGAVGAVFGCISALAPLSIWCGQRSGIGKFAMLDRISPLSYSFVGTNTVSVVAIVVIIAVRAGVLRAGVLLLPIHAASVALGVHLDWFPFSVLRGSAYPSPRPHYATAALAVGVACVVWYRSAGTSWNAIRNSRIG